MFLELLHQQTEYRGIAQLGERFIQEVSSLIPLIYTNLKSLKTIGIQGLFHF